MNRYDAIVVGTGGVGSAALLHLADAGLRVLGLDAFGRAHDRGSSHGRTRMIRQAYFEHPDYVPLVLEAYRRWAELESRRGECLFVETGLLEVGPAGGQVLPGVRASARRHDLEIDELSAVEIRARWRGFRVDDAMSGIYERRAGYLRTEACVLAHLELAVAAGADLRTEQRVTSWQAMGAGVIVETAADRYTADHLVMTAGSWTAQLLGGLGMPLEVRRKPVYWFAAADDAYDADAGVPAFLFELPTGVFYGFPRIDSLGVKVAMHSGGRVIDDPDALERAVDEQDLTRVRSFVAAHLPSAGDRCIDHSVCMYTMTTDEHFIVDRHPLFPQVVFAAGLSGHGFKFTPVLGQALAELVTRGGTELPIAFLRCDRPGLR